jgi:hypothetical protein
VANRRGRWNRFFPASLTGAFTAQPVVCCHEIAFWSGMDVCSPGLRDDRDATSLRDVGQLIGPSLRTAVPLLQTSLPAAPLGC